MATKKATTKKSSARKGGQAVKGSTKKTAGAKATAKKPSAAASSARQILAWEDDPASQMGQTPLTMNAPKLTEAPLQIQFLDASPSPKVYGVGTPEFRFWSAAASLRRAAKFWGGLVPESKWFTGKKLPVTFDAGTDLNAYYDRQGLTFFHDNVSTGTVFSAESPDIASHELGHAVLDAIRPELWDVMGIEVAAFHESFGDMSAILVALQLPSVRKDVLAETGGRIAHNSRLSRIAEQLGAALRERRPHSVDSDCLRNAANSFFYRDPETLPPSAPSNALSTQPHSFSRIFTAGFLEALGAMLATLVGQGGTPTSNHLLKISQDAGRLLVDAIVKAPIVADYFSHVAAHMILADEARFKKRYRDALKTAFVRRGIISLETAVKITGSEVAVSARRGIAAAAPIEVDAGGATRVPLFPLSADNYGLPKNMEFLCKSPGQTKRVGVQSSAPARGSLQPPAPEVAAESFVADLFRLGRIDFKGFGDTDSRVTHRITQKTHELQSDGTRLKIVRRTFDCGFD